jgi:hypothetical protein
MRDSQHRRSIKQQSKSREIEVSANIAPSHCWIKAYKRVYGHYSAAEIIPRSPQDCRIAAIDTVARKGHADQINCDYVAALRKVIYVAEAWKAANGGGIVTQPEIRLTNARKKNTSAPG